jgi:NAD(P)-dependent dehydrogenase (short-subunit alcohol dehydrogenase family)
LSIARELVTIEMMPSVPKYFYNGPIDCRIPTDHAALHGKSVVITGGANGMGEQAVRDFVAVGCFVTFSDINLRGKEIEANLGKDRCCFIEADIRDWDAQVRMFEAAKEKSPNRSVDVVIANAGVSRVGYDSLWTLDGKSDDRYGPVQGYQGV